MVLQLTTGTIDEGGRHEAAAQGLVRSCCSACCTGQRGCGACGPAAWSARLRRPAWEPGRSTASSVEPLAEHSPERDDGLGAPSPAWRQASSTERAVVWGSPVLRSSSGSLSTARRLWRDDAAPQLARFLVVGVGNTAISFVVYRLLLVVSTPYVIAAGLGFAVGALNGYVFNRR
jgi:hypothetical protein